MKKFYSVLFIISCLSSAVAQQNLQEIFENDDTILLTSFLEKADVDECLPLGSSYSLLALSIKFDAKKIFNDLINTHKADVNLICSDKSPLMYAAKYGHLDMAEILLKAGANHKAESNKGKTAYDYAIKYGHKSIADLLFGFMR